MGAAWLLSCCGQVGVGVVRAVCHCAKGVFVSYFGAELDLGLVIYVLVRPVL